MLTFLHSLGALVLWMTCGMAYLMWDPAFNYPLFRHATLWDVSLD